MLPNLCKRLSFICADLLVFCLFKICVDVLVEREREREGRDEEYRMHFDIIIK